MAYRANGKVRYREIIRERERDYGDDDRERDPDNFQHAYEQAIRFAGICYGIDGTETVKLLALGEKSGLKT
jgi:hypothetical protein